MKTSTLLSVALGAAAAHAQQTAWGQCGGTGWTGPTTCVSGYVCTYSNEWYSQCIPGTAATTTTSKATGTTLTTSTTKATTTSSTGSLGWKWLGVDESGAEFGSTSIPGTWGVDFIFPADSSLSVSQGSRPTLCVFG